MTAASGKMIYSGGKRCPFLLSMVFFILPHFPSFAGAPHTAKIAMVSMEATHQFRSSLESKITAVKPLVIEAGKQAVDLIVLPEYYFRGSSLFADMQDLSDSVVIDSMKSFARDNHVNIIFQLVEKSGIEAYNTAVVVDRLGNYVGKYRKVNLPPEEAELTPGDTCSVFDLDFGKIGILICWDAWFTNPAKRLVEKGAELIVIPTWCNIESNMEAITAENGIPLGYAILRVECGAGAENLPSSVYNRHGDLISHNHPVGNNKMAIADVALGKYVNLALGKKVSPPGEEAGYPSENLVDGIYSSERDTPLEMQTSWKSAVLPKSLEIDLEAAYRVERISVFMYHADNYDFRLEGRSSAGGYYLLSDSLTKYETILEHGIAGSELYSVRLKPEDLPETRYVKLTVSSSLESEITINEVKIFGYTEPGFSSTEEPRIQKDPAGTGKILNFPNPFNPDTMIKYSLNNNGYVSLRVFDIHGRLVKELVESRMSAGEHRIAWKGENQKYQPVSSGIYIANLKIESDRGMVRTDSKKLVLVR